MPFEVGQAVNGSAEWVSGSPYVSKVMGNPLTAALVLTVVVLAIVHYVFRHDLEDATWQQKAKAACWIGIASAVITFLHYYVYNRKLRRDAEADNIRGVVNAIHESAAMGGGYEVRPMPFLGGAPEPPGGDYDLSRYDDRRSDNIWSGDSQRDSWRDNRRDDDQRDSWRNDSRRSDNRRERDSRRDNRRPDNVRHASQR